MKPSLVVVLVPFLVAGCSTLDALNPLPER